MTTPLSGIVGRQQAAMINMHTRFEVSSLSRSRDILDLAIKKSVSIRIGPV